MNREGIDAVTAIALENPKQIGIWCSSTPTGKRDFFWEICTNPDTGYTSYHFPSSVNPQWDAMMEGELRATMTHQSYIHEVDAEFGEETVGVFSKEAVERAYTQYLYSYRTLNEYEKHQAIKNGYRYEDILFYGPYTIQRPAPPAKRIIGVDWDKDLSPLEAILSNKPGEFRETPNVKPRATLSEAKPFAKQKARNVQRLSRKRVGISDPEVPGSCFTG